MGGTTGARCSGLDNNRIGAGGQLCSLDTHSTPGTHGDATGPTRTGCPAGMTCLWIRCRQLGRCWTKHCNIGR
eukprot:3603597-Rhodomonas_salina.1